MKRSEKNSGTTIDVLLTYPADPVRLFDSMVPLGLASIAAVLEANSYKVKVIDFNHYRGDYRKDLRAWQPKIVGIGGTTAGMRVYPGTPLETMLKKNRNMPADFSWARYKSPLKNLLLFEIGDVLVLDQPGLGFVKLFRVIVLLAQQKTLTSGAYITKMLAQNAGVFLDRLFSCFIHFQHRMARILDNT